MSNLSNLDKAIEIVNTYAPKFYKDNRLAIIMVLMNNADYVTALIGFDAFASTSNRVSSQEAGVDIVHDIAGLHNEERFFLPRLDSFRGFKAS